MGPDDSRQCQAAARGGCQLSHTHGKSHRPQKPPGKMWLMASFPQTFWPILSSPSLGYWFYLALPTGLVQASGDDGGGGSNRPSCRWDDFHRPPWEASALGPGSLVGTLLLQVSLVPAPERRLWLFGHQGGTLLLQGTRAQAGNATLAGPSTLSWDTVMLDSQPLSCPEATTPPGEAWCPCLPHLVGRQAPIRDQKLHRVHSTSLASLVLGI